MPDAATAPTSPNPAPNRVTPGGEIVAIAQRGTFMGNRGSIHRAPHDIARPWQVRRWITCVLEFKGWVAPMWAPGRWTALFFWDEAVALAAGHRPCALCRRPDYNRWRDAWQAAFGERPGADAMDLRLHADRLDGRRQRHHSRPWPEIPDGTFVAVEGDATAADARTTAAPDATAVTTPAGEDATPALVVGNHLLPWSPAGYGPPRSRPTEGNTTVLTPRATVDVIAHGYTPALHPSAGTGAD